jgi:hypothetical protein
MIQVLEYFLLHLLQLLKHILHLLALGGVDGSV